MAALKHSDSRRLYSWWWDSHISPKNSKWLQDNLTDMDAKIKAMIKLIEEDADSFARRAEMYYKKRPELMRLVEEFYRAYRALAERYDHATGALRQAHRTIAEAFPNQMPTFSDDMSSASSLTDEYTFGPSDLPNDLYGSPHSNGSKRNGIYSDDGDSLADRKGLRQTGGIFTSQDGNIFSNASERRIRKSLNFSDDGMETTQLKSLQEKISKLSSENESLKLEVSLGSKKSSNLEGQVKQLQEAHSKLDSEKDEAIRHFQECLRRVVELEAQIEVFRKVNAELLEKVERLNSNEEMCHYLEKENQSLSMRVDMLIKEANTLQEDHLHKREEIEKLKCLLYNEHFRAAEAESAVETLQKLHVQSQEELESSMLKVQHGSQMLKEMETMKKILEENISQLQEDNDSLCNELKQKREDMNKLSVAFQNECKRSTEIEAMLQSLENLHGQSLKELELLMLDAQSRVHDLKEVEMRKQFLMEELSKIKGDIQSLNERNTSLVFMIKTLQSKILCLIDVQEQLKNKVALQSDEKSVLQGDINSLKGEINNLHLRQGMIADQMKAVGLSEESFQASVKSLQNDNLKLKETCKRHEAEKLLLFESLAHMDNISEKNIALEISLSATIGELQGLREKMVMLQQACDSLHGDNASLLQEKNSLILKVETIEGHVEELTKKNTFIECSLSDANTELDGLRKELKNMEESYQSLYNDKCSLDVEKNALLSEVENMGFSLENLKKKHEMLHDERLQLEKEKEITRRQLIDLQDSLKQEKQDHEDFRHHRNAKLAILESQISKLNESNLYKEEQLKNEQHKLFSLEVERFILQRCISDLINSNLSLQNKYQELEQDNEGHKEKNMMLSSVNVRLMMEMQMIMNALNKKGCDFTHGEQSCLQDILDGISGLQNSVLAAKNEHLGLIIESSINDILFREIAYNAAELASNNRLLEQMSRLRTDELLGLQTEQCNLLERYELLHNEHLHLEKQKEQTTRLVIDLQDSLNREKQNHEDFKHRSDAELAILKSQISKLNESNLSKEEQLRNEQQDLFNFEVEKFILQRCISDLIYDNRSLKHKYQELEKDNKSHMEKSMMLSSDNRKLEMEMQMIMKAIKKEGFNFTRGQESRLQDVLDNISELQNSVLAARNEHLGLIFQNSINDVLVREIASSAAELESNNRSLEQMYRLKTDELLGLQAERHNFLETNKHLEENLEASSQTEKMLKEKIEILQGELSASKEAEFMLREDNHRLTKEISSLSSQLCGLGKEKDILEEEINGILQENMALDCLSVMVKQFNIETSLKLKALLADLRCAHDSRNHLVGKVKELNDTIEVLEAENCQVKSLLSKFEEFKHYTIVLAVESSITKHIANELNSQIYQTNQQMESTEKLLTQKEQALLEVCMILQKLQKVEEKLLSNLKDTKLELDDAKYTKDNLEKKVSMLSEDIISKDNDIAQSFEANAALVLELEKLQKENGKLRINSSNLQKDIHCCEDEVAALLDEFQITTVRAAVYEDKLLQLMNENIAANKLVQRRDVNNELALKDADIEKLSMEVNDLKGQNRTLKAELDDYLPVISSLEKSLCGLESLIISSNEDGNMKGYKLDCSYEQHPISSGDKFPKGISELKKLQEKVESIQEALGHYGHHYVAHSNNLTDEQHGDQTKARVEELRKSVEYATVDMIEQVDKTEESGDVLHDAQTSNNKDELIMKDIQLDHALSPSKPERGTCPYEIVGNDAMQTDDQMLELWQTDEWDHSNNSVKPPEDSWHYMRHNEVGSSVNPPEDSWRYTGHDEKVGRSEHPSSEFGIEKELGVDKLAMPNRNKEKRQDWNKVLERLLSDAQRLTALDSGILELKNKVERSVRMHPKNLEYDDIRGQLQEAEENILQLLDMNKKLIQKAEISTSSSSFVEPESMNQRWRQVSGRARRGSEKIGRLELELQKLQYIFLKLEELDNQKLRAADRRSRVLLRDYLYGSSQSRKKNLYLCCFRPKTKAG